MEEMNAPRYIPFTNKAKALLATLLAAPPVAVGAETFARTGGVLESIIAGVVAASVEAIPFVAYYLNNLYYGQHQPIIRAVAGGSR